MRGLRLTYALIFSQANEPEPDGQHTGMDCQRDSFSSILELRSFFLGQRRRHEEGEGTRAERIARCSVLYHIGDVRCVFS